MPTPITKPVDKRRVINITVHGQQVIRVTYEMTGGEKRFNFTSTLDAESTNRAIMIALIAFADQLPGETFDLDLTNNLN